MERENRVSFFDARMKKKKKFLVVKKKRREILREEDKGDVVKCCFV